MARDWHETFKIWSKPASDSEEDKAARAAEMIRKALRSAPVLEKHNFEVYATGSYANNTNVRLESDIDVAIVLEDALWYELPVGVTAADVGLRGSVAYGLDEFRADVHGALVAVFGNRQVQPRNKTFSIRENTSRLSADATPFLRHRRYTGRNSSGAWQYHEGAELRPCNDPNRRIINWHRQHYQAGVDKNDRTRRRYKRVVRILKNLAHDMEACGTPTAKNAAAVVPSFLLECLVFNAPDGSFALVEGSYYEDVKSVVRWLWNETKVGGSGERFTEVSGLKPLFSSDQAWTMAKANTFLAEAWQHVRF